jgi:demethylmenaquinone methyltransferase/2-methoxy-6-polyprenyl-1,4-benzoquinol methylase
MAGWLTGQKDAYEYLGGSIEAFPSGRGMIDLLESCGFKDSTATPLTLGVVTIYQGTC